MDGNFKRLLFALHDFSEEERPRAGKVAGKDVLRNVNSGEGGPCVERCSDNAGEADEAVEQRLEPERIAAINPVLFKSRL